MKLTILSKKICLQIIFGFTILSNVYASELFTAENIIVEEILPQLGSTGCIVFPRFIENSKITEGHDTLIANGINVNDPKICDLLVYDMSISFIFTANKNEEPVLIELL